MQTQRQMMIMLFIVLSRNKLRIPLGRVRTPLFSLDARTQRKSKTTAPATARQTRVSRAYHSLWARATPPAQAPLNRVAVSAPSRLRKAAPPWITVSELPTLVLVPPLQSRDCRTEALESRPGADIGGIASFMPTFQRLPAYAVGTVYAGGEMQ